MSKETVEKTMAIGSKLADEAVETTANGKTIDRLFKEIVINEVRPAIPEVVFATHYAPMFVDYVKGTISEDSALIAEWVSIAGTPFNEVDVIDKDGKVVDTVPGLIAKPVVGAPLNNISLSGIIDEYEKKANITPEVGEKFLNNSFKTIENNIKTTVNEPVAKWSKILSKYVAGEEQPKTTDKNKQASATPVHTDKLEIEYD